MKHSKSWSEMEPEPPGDPMGCLLLVLLVLLLLVNFNLV